MRLLTLLSAISCFVMLTACHKTKNSTQHAFSLPGTWRLFSEVGGIGGLHETFPVSQGHQSYTFRADSTCMVINNTDTLNTTYSIRLETDTYCHITRQYLHLQGGGRTVISNSHDTLWLGDDCSISDGMGYGFIKD